MAELMDLDLVLVRHGEPEGDWHGRFLGRTDPDLGELGLSQAAALAEALPGLLGGRAPEALHASPLQRALQTAAPIADAFGLTIERDGRLQEIDFGSWDGKHREEVEVDDPQGPERWFENPHLVPPGGGETFEAVAERVGAWIADLQTPSGPLIMVAHFGVVAVCASLLLGLPLSQADRLCLHRGQAGRIHHGVLSCWGLPARDPGRRRAWGRRA